jgi:hypothetical protein
MLPIAQFILFLSGLWSTLEPYSPIHRYRCVVQLSKSDQHRVFVEGIRLGSFISQNNGVQAFFNTIKLGIQFDAIDSIFLDGKATTLSDLRCFLTLRHCTTIWLESKLVDDNTIHYIYRNKSLVNLFIFHSSLTDKGLKSLTLLPHLDTLDLQDAPLTGSGFQDMKGMDRLAILRLGSTRFDDSGFTAITGFKNLVALDLKGTPVRGEGLGQLAALPKLSGLVLDDTKINDATLLNLKPLTRLQSLSLENTEITDKSLDVLSTLKGLKSLDIAGTGISREGVEWLRGKLPDARIFD